LPNLSNSDLGKGIVNMDYAVIMAGGTGKRLWPLSRETRPKQVLRLFGGKTLLEGCLDRLLPMFDPSRIFVLTNAAYVDIVRESLGPVPPENVVPEPAVRDTAGAIGLAAAILDRMDDQATMAVVTADQMIQPMGVFQQALKDALCFVGSHPRASVTFGINPTHAATTYGYVKCQEGQSFEGCVNSVHAVDSFREKPDEATAQSYIEHGHYYWNSGIFVWKARRILELIHCFLPDAREPLLHLGEAWGTAKQVEALNTWFVRLPKISIDFAVMEKADQVYAIRMDCDWLDMGSYTALSDVMMQDAQANFVAAEKHVLLDCAENIVVTEEDGHLIAGIGLKGLVVAHSPNATLICPRDQLDKLKGLLMQIEEQGGSHFL
jgi:mannose-1-phosphate guanylyltransferase